MVYSCCACRRKCIKGSGVSFFSFPKNELLRNEWLKYCGFDIHARNNTSTLKLCSKHFAGTSFRITREGGPLFLKSDAIPSILLKNIEPRTQHSKTINQPLNGNRLTSINSATEDLSGEMNHPVNTQLITDQDQSPKKRQIWGPRHAMQMSTQHFGSPRLAQRNLNIIKQDIKIRDQRIRQLIQKTYRMRKKIKTLEQLVESLQKNA